MTLTLHLASLAHGTHLHHHAALAGMTVQASRALAGLVQAATLAQAGAAAIVLAAATAVQAGTNYDTNNLRTNMRLW